MYRDIESLIKRGQKKLREKTDTKNKVESNVRHVEWIDIGVEGLSDFIPGLPKGDAILVRGEPGTGKTILCIQFLYKGVENGEKGI